MKKFKTEAFLEQVMIIVGLPTKITQAGKTTMSEEKYGPGKETNQGAQPIDIGRALKGTLAPNYF